MVENKKKEPEVDPMEVITEGFTEEEKDNPKDDIDLGEIASDIGNFFTGKKVEKRNNEDAPPKRMTTINIKYYNTEQDTYYKIKDLTETMKEQKIDKKHIKKALQTILNELK